MNKYIVVSDGAPKPYEGFLTEELEAISEYKVKGLAMVILVESKETNALVGYWNMNVTERAYAATHMQADVVDGIIKYNLRKYRDMMEALDDEEEPDEV